MEEKDATATVETGLKDFVRQAIREVLEGVEEAREETADASEPNTFHEGTEIKFDVAVTTSESGGSGGSFGIGVAKVIEAGIETQEQMENTATNRVQFSIPVQIKPIPSGDDERTDPTGARAY